MLPLTLVAFLPVQSHTPVCESQPPAKETAASMHGAHAMTMAGREHPVIGRRSLASFAHLQPPRFTPARGRCGSKVLAPLVATLAFIGSVFLPGGQRPAAAQARIQVAPMPAQAEDDKTPGRNPFAAVLHPSEEATTLLSRARQGIEREDWKLAVDSLQRIVELPGEHVLTSDGQVYESARRHAHRRIAGLPGQGLAAYRLMYDGEATALLAKAVQAHDLAGLRLVVDRYLITSVGDEAAVMLADWLIDEGRFAEAAAILQSVQALHPASDLPAWGIPSRLAVCYAGLGRRQRAEAALKPVLPGGAATTRPAGVMAPERLAAVQAYVNRPTHSGEDAEMNSWPMAYGRASRDGMMPVVEPAIIDNLPWLANLPIPQPREGFGPIREYAMRRGLLPAANLVTDEQTLVVKSGPVLQAMDSDTFEVLWAIQPGTEHSDTAIIEETGAQAAWQTDARRDAFDQLENDATVRRLLRDSVGSNLSIASGLVFTVEWPNEPPPNVAMGMDQQFRPFLGAAGFTNTYPNRIVAYSLKTGKPAWKSSIRAVDNKLGPMEFLSAPVPVNDQLLVPCRVNTDLYAAIFETRTGRLLRTIYLCGTGGGPFDSLYALMPCVADGVVYLPTGRGVVIALEASNWSVRWAVRYDGMGKKSSDGNWLPTPIIAAADSILVAPQDADYLYCLDRATGEVRWSVERGEHLYVLGATDKHVWMAGEDAALVEIETGKRLWNEPAGEPAGRGVVAGDRIYLPTVKGLVAMHALTGQRLELREPGGEPTELGNLLAWNAALYSVTPTQVRKFPDLERGYAEALARHQADPADAPHAIRLARLELLRHAPQKALDALARVPADLKETSPTRYQHVNHLRVGSMLELAGSGDRASDESRRLLEEARRIAILPRDAIDSVLALGAYHCREGRLLDGCREYLSLALSEAGDQMVSEGDEFELRARSIAMRHIADALKAMTPEDAARLNESVRKTLREAAENRNPATLLWLMESTALGDVSSEAELTLGRWAAEDLRLEHAEGYFQRVIRRAQSPGLQAEACARLATIYLQPDELHQPVSAVRLLDRLEQDLAGVPVPADVLDPEITDPTTRPAGEARTLRAGQAAQALRRRVNQAAFVRHQAALSPIRLSKLGEPTSQTLREARPLLYRGGHIEPLAARWLTFAEGKRVDAYSAETGKLLWPAELRLLNELAVESRVGEDATEQQLRVFGVTTGPLTAARGLVEGQTLILNSTYGIHAIGLLTGRRLWSRRFDPPVTGQQEIGGSDAWLWVHDGYVISVDAYGELEVSYANAGDRLLWRRKRPARRWFAVRARGEYVVAVDINLEKADIFRLADGRYLGACEFKQNADRARKVNITLYEDVICGPVSDNTVAALELATPGVERWRVSASSDLSQIFKPSANLLAVADRAGRVQLVDPASGKSRLPAVKTEACADGIVDGSIQGGVLYVCGFKKRVAASNLSEADQQRWGLAAVRISDGTVLWQRDDFGARAHLNQDILETSANAIPVVVLSVNSEAQRFQAPGVRSGNAAKVEVVLVDKADGKEIGEKITASLDPETSAWRILNVDARPGQLHVAAGPVHLHFPFDHRPLPTATAPAEGGARAGPPEAHGAGLDAGRGGAGGETR